MGKEGAEQHAQEEADTGKGNAAVSKEPFQVAAAGGEGKPASYLTTLNGSCTGWICR